MVTRLTVRRRGGTGIDLAGWDDALVPVGVTEALLEEATHLMDHLLNKLNVSRRKVRVDFHLLHDLSSREGCVETQQDRINDEAGDRGKERDANFMQVGVDYANLDVSVVVDRSGASGDQDAKVHSTCVVKG